MDFVKHEMPIPTEIWGIFPQIALFSGGEDLEHMYSDELERVTHTEVAPLKPGRIWQKIMFV